ncbi:MAG: DNA-binding transcriptional regulator [Phycisphaerae bacterium]|nr:DNA-binding transcriptional regulator [Phycisphaerae bacterium]
MKKIPRIIVIAQTISSYGRGLIRGIARYSRLHGPWSFFSERGEPQDILPLLKNWNPNGAIICTAEEKINKTLIPFDLPTIVIPSKGLVAGYPNIFGDWENDSIIAAEYFLNLGFRNFAYCGFSNLEWSKFRARYFFERLAKEGNEEVFFYDKPFLFLHKDWQNELEELADWLVSLPKPVAVMACNDERGKHVLEACKIAELAVPEQVAVLGVDNDETICELLTQPPLSSIAVNTEKAGYEAAALLDKMMHGQKVPDENIIVQTMQVVSRQSTDILMVDDESVVKAVNFIRLNAKRPLQVEEVANTVGMNRRGLERRFKKSLNRSIHEEIRRVRIELIKKLLLETNMTVSQISNQLDFNEIPHLTRFFSRETGMSPNEFRKQHLGKIQKTS